MCHFPIIYAGIIPVKGWARARARVLNDSVHVMHYFFNILSASKKIL